MFTFIKTLCVENYLDQLKQEWARNGIDADKMMESLRLQWEAMGIDAEAMMNQMKSLTTQHKECLATDDNEDPEGEYYDLDDLPDPMSAWDGDNLLFNTKDGADINLLKAISCGAHLTVINKSFLNSVSTGMNQDDAKQLLLEFWEVDSPDTFLEAIAMLFIATQQDAWEQIRQALADKPLDIWEDAYEEILEDIVVAEEDREETEEYLQNIIDTWPYLNETLKINIDADISVFAWDYCRAINVCRWAYDAGYCSLAEAESWITQAAELLYTAYDSWESLSRGYIVGHAMWNSDLELLNDSLHAHYQLCSQSKSPWQLLDW